MTVLVVWTGMGTLCLLVRTLDRFWCRPVSRKYLEPSYLLRALRRVTGKRHVWLHVFGTRNQMVRALDRVHPRAGEIAEHRTEIELLKSGGPEAAADIGRLKEGILEIYDTQLDQDSLDRAAYVEALQPQIEAVHRLRELGNEAFIDAHKASLDRQIHGS